MGKVVCNYCTAGSEDAQFWIHLHPHLHKQSCKAQKHAHTQCTRGIDKNCFRLSERRWHQNMQKRLCRRLQIFNDESIHYRIRSLCFCCHEMYTFIIGPPQTKSIVPLRPSTLYGKFTKWKKYTQIQTERFASMHTATHINIPKDNKNTHHKIFIQTTSISSHYL